MLYKEGELCNGQLCSIQSQLLLISTSSFSYCMYIWFHLACINKHYNAPMLHMPHTPMVISYYQQLHLSSRLGHQFLPFISLAPPIQIMNDQVQTSSHVQNPLNGTFLLHDLATLCGITNPPFVTPMVILRSSGSFRC